MPTEKLMPVSEFCINHNIEISFIRTLQASGLIKIFSIKGTGFIGISEFKQLEKMVYLYYDLDINIEGLETITHLLNKNNMVQKEMTVLKNRLQLYE